MLYTIEKKIESEIKIKRSRFVAVLYPLLHTEEIRDILNAHYGLFSDATHNCYACILLMLENLPEQPENQF